MQLPANNASTDAHLAAADHVEGAVEAWQDVEIISPEQRQVIGEVGALVGGVAATLRLRQKGAEEADRLVRKARARFIVRDSILDVRVMSLSDGVYNGPALRSREHPAYREVFQDKTAGEITRAAIREEPELVARLLERYDGLPDFPQKAQIRNDVAEALGKSLSARDALDAAEQAERKAADAELTARLQLRGALDEAYNKLRLAFPGRRDFVESFFAKPAPARRAPEA
jgi:hypothetical protein